MGIQLELKIVGIDDSDAPSFTRDFHAQIACGHLWQKRDSFLSDVEKSILTPEWDEGWDEEKLTPVAPSLLKDIFIKVSDYLQYNQDSLPLVHSLSDDKSELDEIDRFRFGSFGYLTIKNSKCWIDGDTYNYDEFNSKGFRYKFNIKNYPDQPDDIDLWLDVKDPIKIDGRLYFMRTITKYQQFESMIQDVIAYCDKAIALNKKVLWING